jgi:hypothetical protein
VKESQFGFEYTWADLKPIRALAVTVVVGQLVGAGVSVSMSTYASLFLNVWVGGALASFPSFLLGLLIQYRINPDAIRENRTMVRRVGLIALVISLAVFVMPLDLMDAQISLDGSRDRP